MNSIMELYRMLKIATIKQARVKVFVEDDLKERSRVHLRLTKPYYSLWDLLSVPKLSECVYNPLDHFALSY